MKKYVDVNEKLLIYNAFENEYEKEIVSSFLLLQCLNIDILRDLVDMEKILFLDCTSLQDVYIQYHTKCNLFLRNCCR